MTETPKKRRSTIAPTNLDELKAFIVWAKSEGVTRIKVGTVEVELLDAAVVYAVESKLTEQATGQKPEAILATRGAEERDTSKTLVDTEQVSKQDEEELLFWSAN